MIFLSSCALIILIIQLIELFETDLIVLFSYKISREYLLKITVNQLFHLKFYTYNLFALIYFSIYLLTGIELLFVSSFLFCFSFFRYNKKILDSEISVEHYKLFIHGYSNCNLDKEYHEELTVDNLREIFELDSSTMLNKFNMPVNQLNVPVEFAFIKTDDLEKYKNLTPIGILFQSPYTEDEKFIFHLCVKLK